MMTNGGVVSEGMEADVVIHSRVFIKEIDEAGEQVRVSFGEDVDESSETAWVAASSIREVKAVTATAELFVDYWRYIRELVDKAAGDAPQHMRDSKTTSILNKIDEIIDPKWLLERKARIP